MHVQVCQNQATLFWGAVQYYYRWLMPVSDEHTSQLPMEHTTHATIKGAKRYSKRYPSRPVRFSLLWMSESVATWQYFSSRASNTLGYESYA